MLDDMIPVFTYFPQQIILFLWNVKFWYWILSGLMTLQQVLLTWRIQMLPNKKFLQRDNNEKHYLA